MRLCSLFAVDLTIAASNCTCIEALYYDARLSYTQNR